MYICHNEETNISTLLVTKFCICILFVFPKYLFSLPGYCLGYHIIFSHYVSLNLVQTYISIFKLLKYVSRWLQILLHLWYKAELTYGEGLQILTLFPF